MAEFVSTGRNPTDRHNYRVPLTRVPVIVQSRNKTRAIPRRRGAPPCRASCPFYACTKTATDGDTQSGSNSDIRSMIATKKGTGHMRNRTTRADALDSAEPKPARHDKTMRKLAQMLVHECVRNTQLETLHTGITPSSASGDFEDVKVITPFGEIPWNRLSRISDAEMKPLIIEIVNKVYTYLSHAEHLSRLPSPAGWQTPEYDAPLLATAMRLAKVPITDSMQR